METPGAVPPLEQVLLLGRERLLAFIRSRVADPDLAEDILQDSLLKALRAVPGLRDEEKVIPWFYQVVRNAITDAHRRKYRDYAHRRALSDVAEPSEHVLAPEEEAALCACFRALIPALKPEYAVLIDAMELGDEDPEAVAKRMGITRNNLKVRRHRARQQLRERLEMTCRTCATHGCLDCSCKRS